MPAAGEKPAPEPDMYASLGVSKTATNTEIRRAYRNLITKEHPDKGGDAVKFKRIQRAYDVLSDPEKRSHYDATGEVERSVEEELLETFGGGAFRDTGRDRARMEKESLADAIVSQEKQKESHTSGFEAWMRARGESLQTYGVDEVIERNGVVKGSYDEVQLPKIRAFNVMYKQPSMTKPAEAFEVKSTPLPPTLEWGQVLINVKAASIGPGDIHPLFASSMDPATTEAMRRPPFVAGSSMIATVLKTGAGIKQLNEGDWVVPHKPGSEFGAWASIAVVREKDLIKIPTDLMPLEYAAMHRELCVAYRLLEDHGDLKPGDAVILNGATGAIGGCVIQLCAMLKLRAIAVVRRHETGPASDPVKVEKRLKALGAAEVLVEDDGKMGASGLKLELEKQKFFAKPKLALDCVGGVSASRLAETLQDGCELVCFGCVTGKAVTVPWTGLVGRGLVVRGFSLRKWMAANKKKVPKMLETLAKLVNADKIRIDFTEYELSSEFTEAMEHALEPGKGTKVLLRVNDVGSTYT